jgi:large subunit ribosomal protein L5
MASLREVPRSARQMLKSASALTPAGTSSFLRCASTGAAPAAPTNSAAAVPDIEHGSGLDAPALDRKSITIEDPRKRASRREQELPHSR